MITVGGKSLGITSRWRTSVRAGLSALACEIAPDTASKGPELFSEMVLLHFYLLHASSSRNRAGQPAPKKSLQAWSDRATSASEPIWPALCKWLLSEDLSWREGYRGPDELRLLRRLPLSNKTLLAVLRALTPCEEKLGQAPHSFVTNLGTLHQLLLQFSLELRPRAAIQLRHGEWISPAIVLNLGPNERLKYLKSRTSVSAQSLRGASAAVGRAGTRAELIEALQFQLAKNVEPPQSNEWQVVRGLARRRAGAHYTPWDLCRQLVEQALNPLLEHLKEPRSDNLLRLRICDPAMGAGVFLVASCQLLANALVEAWRLEGQAPFSDPDACARLLICRHVLHGVDHDPYAVSLARSSLYRLCGEQDELLPDLQRSLVLGNSVVGEARRTESPSTTRPPTPATTSPFHWSEQFSEVFDSRMGFDAMIGNPPWVSYVGRAAQPLAPEVADYFKNHNPAFHRYRTLHGLFVYRCASLLRMGGRLGLLLPTSVADLDGYEPTRLAHDELCEVDSLLPDWEDGAFEGVFQPTMALLSTRRSTPTRSPLPQTWPLGSPLEDTTALALLQRLEQLPSCPPALFGERGYQTRPEDRAHMRRQAAAAPPFTTALHEGSDVTEFQSLPPAAYVNKAELSGRLRSSEEWSHVAVWIRQTSRFPIASLANGTGFRNSILAGFASEEYPAPLLLAYLNSTLIRWFHYSRHRDARQGMPQLKIGHLRRLPELPPNCRQRAELIAMGSRLGYRNRGISSSERTLLDTAICDAFEVTEREREVLTQWRDAFPAPRSRRGSTSQSSRRQKTPQGL